MKVALVHNYYQQSGGEDRVFLNEHALLDSHGHRVLRYTVHNDRITEMSAPGVALKTVWNQAVCKDLRSLIRRERPRVIHFHNTFPLISPAAYGAAKTEGVPVVQTLHNYRLLCLNGLFFRDGRVCEDCLGKAIPWPGVVHSCYRDDRAASGTVATMLVAHRALRTWVQEVDVFVALTEFARRKFVEGGIAEEKIVVKPNFIHPDPGVGEGGGGYALFVGRLSVEKGVRIMLAAWERLQGQFSLKVVGDGPLAADVQDAAERIEGIEWLGHRPREEVDRLIGEAELLILPSDCYETFGLVAVEALARGTPVVAADVGAAAELIEHGRTGLHFRSSDAEDLAVQVRWALKYPSRLVAMRREARAEYEEKYTPNRNHQMLMDIYELAMDRSTPRAVTSETSR